MTSSGWSGWFPCGVSSFWSYPVLCQQLLFARSSDRETIILRTGIMALLPCVSEVKENFKQVQGKKFKGYFVGTHYIDQTDSYLDIVEINNGKFTELLGVRSIGKSRFRFSKSKSGFPNRTRNPKTDFTSEKCVLRVDFN